MPAVLLTLYFTYSRGGLLSLVVAVLCLLVLSRDRLWLLATLAIAALATLPAVLAVQDRRELADNLGGQAMADQGATVLLILLGGIALALAALRGAATPGSPRGRLTGRALEMSRNPSLLRWMALAGAVVAVGVTIAVGGRAWDQFSSPDLQFPDQPEKHFGQLSGAGRHDFWRVSIDAFGERPLLGGGAGTYEFSWEEGPLDRPAGARRPLALPRGVRRAGGGRRAARARPGRRPAVVRLRRLARGARRRSESATRCWSP